jgi:tRNA-(ms[2]io[6]A)-hydroxylase
MLCLKVPTDSAWVDHALSDIDAVLADHAHCEMKAASNALSLAARHPGDATLVRALAELAREEIEHFQRVLERLVDRGVRLAPPPVDPYAAELRRAVHALPHLPGDSGIPAEAAPLVDRLLVGALIEARSCERFKLLADATARDASALSVFWAELMAAEARHYRTFIELAERAAGGDPGVDGAHENEGAAHDRRAAVHARLDRIARVEAQVVAAVASAGVGASRATIHG